MFSFNLGKHRPWESWSGYYSLRDIHWLSEWKLDPLESVIEGASGNLAKQVRPSSFPEPAPDNILPPPHFEDDAQELQAILHSVKFRAGAKGQGVTYTRRKNGTMAKSYKTKEAAAEYILKFVKDWQNTLCLLTL